MLTDTVCRESIGGDDVSTGFDILAVNVADDRRSRQTEHVVVSHERYRPLGKASLMVAVGRQSLRLNLRAHRTIQNEYSLS